MRSASILTLPPARDHLYPQLTLDRYNQAIQTQLDRKRARTVILALLGGTMTLLLTEAPRAVTLLDSVSNGLKLSWLLPVPYFAAQVLGFHSGLNGDLLLDPGHLKERGDELADKRVVYTIATKGENPTTLRDTVDSTLYWTELVKERYGLRYLSEVWVVTEDESLLRDASFYTALEERGVRVLATPTAYETPNRSRWKTRALEYAAEIRGDEGSDTSLDWVYHQDTETMVGEDTVLGNLAFILDADPGTVAGSGVILYPQEWGSTHTSLQETTRSFADLAAVGHMNLWGWMPFGYHGSHILVRSDAEAAVGWDYGKVRSEDLVFSVKLRQRYGACLRPLKGFAYEKPPLTLRDHLRQRRRWILGSLEALGRRDIPLRSKATILYSDASWLSSLPSLAATALTFINPTGGFLPRIGGAVTGLVWWSLFQSYAVGLEMHESYVKPGRSIPGLVRDAALGMAADAASPWYALLAETEEYDEISKDQPRPAREHRAPAAEPTWTPVSEDG